ncbi:crotonase/enoyl-CoA hydratase family protein [Streptomyces sp. NPDC102279]|uniref:crotonase/enoyl-CoA hydratase family protein n=1 Tax=Streptomyces sp. NPDC102279 TaxID=3366153 RepID=UPI0038204997
MTVSVADTKPRVTLTVAAGVADVRLNRPEKRNALDLAMVSALVTIGEQLKARSDVRAVVLSGEGPCFCAGLDTSAFQAAREGRPHAEATDLPPSDGPAQAAGQRAAYVWTELPVPVIAAVRGNALGGGLQIALGADIRIVAPNARLAMLEVVWGLVPDLAGTQLLPQLVRLDVAKELTFTGRVVSGEEAVRIGLATRVAADPLTAAFDLAKEIAGRSPAAVRAAKGLIGLAGKTTMRTALEQERAQNLELAGTPNQLEAVRARLDGREPRFTDQ